MRNDPSNRPSTSSSVCQARFVDTSSDACCTPVDSSTSTDAASDKPLATLSPPGSPGKSNKDEIQRHWQCILNLLRPQDRLQMAVRLESCHPGRTRYLVVITTDPSTCTTTNLSSCNNTLKCEENCENVSTVTRSDISSSDSKNTIKSPASKDNGGKSSRLPHKHLNFSPTKRNSNALPADQTSEGSKLTPLSTPIPIPVTSPCVHSTMTRETTTTAPLDAVSSFPPFSVNRLKSVNSKKERKHHYHHHHHHHHLHARQRVATSVLATVSKVNGNSVYNARRIIQESCLLGVDFSLSQSPVILEHEEKDGHRARSDSSEDEHVDCQVARSQADGPANAERSNIGLVFPVWADTTINLDGDGGFSVSSGTRQHIFKPISVQAMWSSLQMIHEASSQARSNNFYQGGQSHKWTAHYTEQIDSDRSCLNEWNAMDGLTSKRPLSPDASDEPSQQKATKTLIRSKLKEIMTSVDLDKVTSKFIRTRLEQELDMNLIEYKSYIDEEMLKILGQMDTATQIFDYLYLGSEWNASNLEELKSEGVGKILNVTHEIDNFYPGAFHYYNVRVDDDDSTEMLQHWDKTYRYIYTAMKEGSKVLVHCKMGISRSASVVIAYVMKAKNWSLAKSLEFVKAKRPCIKPNENFLKQLEVYQGILSASKQRHNSLWRSKSETNFNSSAGGTSNSNSSGNSSNTSSNSSLVASQSSSSEPSSPTQSTVAGDNKAHGALGEGQSKNAGCKQVAQLAELFNNNGASHPFHHHRHSLHNPHHSHTSILQIGLSIESLN